MEIEWSYWGPDEDGVVDLLDGETASATRREWWYEPGETYVYQLRTDAGWGPAYNEHEEEDLPDWVLIALAREGHAVVKEVPKP